VPPHAEYDLLWFIAHYAPDLEQWERDIFLSVRAESLYFYPVFACQIMNEGWASYWHARLLREAEFLPQPLYLSAIKAPLGRRAPFAATSRPALQVQPLPPGVHALGRIVEQRGMDEARRICREEDDFGFVRNYLDRELAEKLDLFAFEAKNDGEIRVVTRDLNAIREAILSPKFNYGAPRIAATELRQDGTLVLTHDHASDGRGLDVARGNRVIQYIRRVWRRPVRLNTVDSRGEPHELSGRLRARRKIRDACPRPFSPRSVSSRPACSRSCRETCSKSPSKAIVNAANGMLAHGGGVAGISRAPRDPELQEESDRIVHERGPFPTGSAIVTTAGKLPFKGVIHAVGPRYGEGAEEEKLEQALRAAFACARERGWRSVSFPAVSSGIFAVPLEICSRAYLRSVRDAKLENVRLCLRDAPVIEAVLAEVARQAKT
jgi:O-acetyl-ADP-ribose deacetylase (regulator of RNase III)